jgi:hypothetical protein
LVIAGVRHLVWHYAIRQTSGRVCRLVRGAFNMLEIRFEPSDLFEGVEQRSFDFGVCQRPIHGVDFISGFFCCAVLQVHRMFLGCVVFAPLPFFNYFFSSFLATGRCNTVPNIISRCALWFAKLKHRPVLPHPKRMLAVGLLKGARDGRKLL